MKQLVVAIIAACAVSACSESDTGSDAEAVASAATAEATAAEASTETNTEASAAPSAQDADYAGFVGDIVYGDPAAEIEIIEYASMTCPHCATFAASIYPKIAEKYIDTGKAKLVFRNFVANSLDLAATSAARCGGEAASGALTKEIFARQQEWARAQDPVAELASIVRKAGVSRVKLDACLRDRDMHEALVKVTQDGLKEFGITGTPTVIVNGEKLESYRFEAVDKAISGN